MNKVNPVRIIIMFVIGCVVMIAAQWLAARLKGTSYAVNWVYIIVMGIAIAAIDALIPPVQRRKNRQKLKDSFKR